MNWDPSRHPSAFAMHRFVLLLTTMFAAPACGVTWKVLPPCNVSDHLTHLLAVQADGYAGASAERPAMVPFILAGVSLALSLVLTDLVVSGRTN